MPGWFRILEISASSLTAERFRMEVIANNIANANTTRTERGGPYRRRVAVLAAREEAPAPFSEWLSRAMAQVGVRDFRPPGIPGAGAEVAGQVGAGVRVVAVGEDPRPLPLRYDPTHPDADANGYVQMPNVDPLLEMVDLISASRAYEANVTAFTTARQMALRTLELGRS
ncbi:MAG: flagellar basal body rod protein FlgC [Bacillota bacterium]|nr:MAG: flagellar basal body rod protein FlgC [Bacillota bacterium]